MRNSIGCQSLPQLNGILAGAIESPVTELTTLDMSMNSQPPTRPTCGANGPPPPAVGSMLASQLAKAEAASGGRAVDSKPTAPRMESFKGVLGAARPAAATAPLIDEEVAAPWDASNRASTACCSVRDTTDVANREKSPSTAASSFDLRTN